jgi:hypothetical protein
MQVIPVRHLRILVGVSEIGDLTGASAAVVTNWRSRFESFPRPAVAGARPQFDLVKVLTWLDSGAGPRDRFAPELSPESWWRLAVRAFHLEALVPAPRETLSALLVLRHHHAGERLRSLIGDSPTDDGLVVARELGAMVTAVEHGDDTPSGVFTPLVEVSSDAALRITDLIRVLYMEGWASDPLQQLDTVLADDNASAGPARTTVTPLAMLMAALSGVNPGNVVFDPACGEGAALLACADLVDRHVVLHGQELEEGTWRIACCRLLLAGLDPSGLAKPGHDSLRADQFPDLRADVVVLDPPVNEPRAPLARWIPHALHHLMPEGRAVIALPLSTLVKVNAARRLPDKKVVRQFDELSDQRRLVGAVVLPRGHRGDVVGPIAVFVIGGAAATRRADEPMVVAAVDTRDQPSDGAVVEMLIASTADRRGLTALAELDAAYVSATFAADFTTFTEALTQAGESVEASITSGPRTSRKPSSATPDEPLAFMSSPLVDIPRMSRTFQQSVDRSTLHSVPPIGSGGIETDVRALVRRIEKLRPLMGDDVYTQLADELDRVKKHL